MTIALCASQIAVIFVGYDGHAANSLPLAYREIGKVRMVDMGGTSPA
jgi:hypothetical protein